MATIFDLVTSQDIAAYWETKTKDMAPYLGDTLFPPQQKLGLDLKWIKGASGLPAVLKPSAFDVKAIPRERIGFEKLVTEMPFFKESGYIDEEMRQELNKILETGNQAYIDTIVERIFNDGMRLLEGAAARREQMRMMLLTTGAINISANGQNYSYDYGVPSTHKVTSGAAWSTANADIISDIRSWQDMIEDDTGVRPSRAICSRKTWSYILGNTAIRNAVWGNSAAAPISDDKAKQYILSELDLEIYVYSKRFINDSGIKTKYVPDDTFVMFPSGDLGTGWFGTTPEQSDLLSQSAINVSVTDTGVAVTTTKTYDPVNVLTKVSMIYLPDFPTADQVIIADVSGS